MDNVQLCLLNISPVNKIEFYKFNKHHNISRKHDCNTFILFSIKINYIGIIDIQIHLFKIYIMDLNY